MPSPLWTPSSDRVAASAMYAFMKKAGHDSYDSLWRWSVREPRAFWRMWLAESGILHGGRVEPVLAGSELPDARWFPEVDLSFAENLLRHDDDRAAIIGVSESRPKRTLSHRGLRREVGRVAQGLRELGIERGDRVAGFIPTIEEAVIAMLAAASLGAVWSSCSPDFGVQGVLDRFGQIEPKVLFAANGYTYNGKRFDCLDKLRRITSALPTLRRTVLIPYLEDHPMQLAGAVAWRDFGGETPLAFTRTPFNHPLYVMYSSGTTGAPKCIVHGAGGTLLQHTKEHLLHSDLRAGDTMVYFTTCGWMMWNWLVSALFTGARVVLYDGSPTHPDMGALWRLAADERLTHFGTSAKFLGACRQQLRGGLTGLEQLRVILSTGSPLLPEDFDWIYDCVKPDVQLASISGGTDIISCFMLGNPMLPVYRGEIQCFGLGMDAAAYDEQLRPVVRQKGELACRTPFPSHPVGFWNDASGDKLRKAYYGRAPHIWFHGDWIETTGSQGEAGGIVVFGRSDATLNPGGVRIGTAEIYRLVETLPEIEDSIVVGQPHAGDVRVVLFVKLAAGVRWSLELEQRVKKTIRDGASPRHVPAVIVPVAAIPYTISGKKVELAVLDVICGREPKNVAALANPEALANFRSRPELDR